MPTSSQALYFHLGMDADDDGFIQPKLVMRKVGFQDDDLKVLIAKRFLLSFEEGVVVIKHWLIHNLIRNDRYKPTRFQEQKAKLLIKENNAYTERLNLGCQNDNQMAPQVRLGKDRLDSDSSTKKSRSLLKVANKENTTLIPERLDTDLKYIETDEDGVELKKSKWGRAPKTLPNAPQAPVARVWHAWRDRCHKELGTRPEGSQSVYPMIRRAFETHQLTEEQVLDVIDEWFGLGKSDDIVTNLKAVLSNANINRWRLINQ